MSEVSAPEVPANVAAAALDQGLGAVAHARKGMNPVAKAGIALVAAVVLFGVLFGLSQFAEWLDTDYRFIRKAIGFVGMAACVFGVGAVIAAVVFLIRGARDFYVFEHGFLYRHNSRLRVIRWDGLTELRGERVTSGENVGKVVGYNLIPVEGAKLYVPLEPVDDRDPLVDELIQRVEGAGKPVI